MLPKVIMFNTISLDGALKDFEMDIGLHYQIAGQYKADVHLIGSETARTGIEMFAPEAPPEEDSDFIKPEIKSGDERPLWAVIDSRGILIHLLHVFRRSEFGKDVIVFIAENTPAFYTEYLEERQYDGIVAGENRIDLRKALEILAENYDAQTVLIDAGTTLISILLANGLVDEISLLISPTLVGNESLKLFEKLNPVGDGIKLRLIENVASPNNHVLLKYYVLK